MTNKLVAVLLLPFVAGCAGVGQGRPERPEFEQKVVQTLTDRYSKPEAIPSDPAKVTVPFRNQILSDLMYLTDINYYRFEEGLYQQRALFETTTDLAILGLGAAGAVVSHGVTQAILAATSAGIAGARVSINKNFFNELSTQALIAKMRSARKQKLAVMQQAMRLEVKDYPLARGLSDVAEYYNAGTIIGALENIVADAGAEGKQADQEIQKLFRGKTRFEAAGPTRPLRDRIIAWLRSSDENVKEFQEWLEKRTPSVLDAPVFWVNAKETTQNELEEAIKDLKIP